MTQLLLAAMTFLSITTVFASSAKAEVSTRRDIQRLARTIDESLLDSTSSESVLIEAREKMESALRLIRQGGGSNNGSSSNDCIQFAYDKYFQSLSSAAAMDKAVLTCRQVESLDILKFLYDKYFQSQSSTAAMDSAMKGSAGLTNGKLGILSFAYDKYFQSQSSTAAANNAILATRNARRDSLQCIQLAYEKYFQSKSNTAALDSAFAACK